MSITISQASKDFKVARSTIYKKIGSGDLSRNADGTIDVAEMVRVFGEPKNTTHATVANTTYATTSDTTVTLQKQEIEFLKRQLQDRDNQISDYRQQVDKLNDRLDSSQDTINELSQTVKLIENKNQLVPAEVKGSFWSWLKWW